MLRRINQFFKNKKGQGLTEYAVILGIVVIIGTTIAGTDSFQSKIKDLYDNVGGSLDKLGTTVSSGNWGSTK